MKVAAFSDVQANLPALEETIAQIRAWDPDLVVMAGDLINRGPDSRGCLELFAAQQRQHGWLAVNGNHEEWVLRCGRQAPRSDGERAVRAFTDWAWGQIAPCAELLEGWADHLTFHPPGADAWVHVTHGTMVSNRDGISPNVTDESLVGKLPAEIALFVTGHTHRPHQRRTQGIDIVNVGSAGSSFDGDPRASYARLMWHGGRWHTEIVRFDYDLERAARDFEESGFLDQSALARLVYLEWQRAEMLIGGWRERYEPAVMAGHISMEQSVTDYLADRGLKLP
jgi:predicted phosphodiesterase